MTKRKRRYRSAEEKARVLRRHLIDKVPVSTICEEEKLQPSVFYQWHRDIDMVARLEMGDKSRRHPKHLTRRPTRSTLSYA